MADIEREAELHKLARILNVERAALEFLAGEDSTRLRVIREGVTDALFTKFRPAFAAFARMSSILPLRLSAEIAKRVLGPMLAGRIAGEMPVKEAIGMAGKLSDDFLAAVCLQMEPKRARAIIADFPVARSVAITDLLRARGELLTMGQFVDVLPTETLEAATDSIADPAELLRIGFFVEEREQLERVIAHLSPDMRAAMIRAAADDELWPQAMHLLRKLGAETRLTLAEQALAQDDAVLDALIRATAAHELWPALLDLEHALDAAALDRLADQPAFDDDAVILSVIDAVHAHDLWAVFERQTTALELGRTARVLEVAADAHPDFLAALARRALPEAVVSDLARAAAELDRDTRQRAAAACGQTRLGEALAAA